MTTTIRKTRPILFSGPMVRAILSGKKNQTRRVIKPQPFKAGEEWSSDTVTGAWQSGFVDVPCPYGNRLDQLWVRETWALGRASHEARTDVPLSPPLRGGARSPVIYKANGLYNEAEFKWRPSIFMPRWACRIKLEIIEVRIQRLKEISEEDAVREGVDAVSMDDVPRQGTFSRRDDFRQLWEKINRKRGFGWDKNSWVWVIEFKKVDG